MSHLVQHQCMNMRPCMRECLNLCVDPPPKYVICPPALSSCHNLLIETSFFPFSSCLPPPPPHSISQLWSTPRRPRSRTSVKAHNLTCQPLPSTTLVCPSRLMPRQRRRTGMLSLKPRPLAALSRAPVTSQQLRTRPLADPRLRNHRLRWTGIRPPSCTWISTTLTLRPQRAAVMC